MDVREQILQDWMTREAVAEREFSRAQKSGTWNEKADAKHNLCECHVIVQALSQMLMTSWHCVSDGMPDIGTPVWVEHSHGRCVAVWDGKNWYSLKGARHKIKTVSKWRLLAVEEE